METVNKKTLFYFLIFILSEICNFYLDNEQFKCQKSSIVIMRRKGDRSIEEMSGLDYFDRVEFLNCELIHIKVFKSNMSKKVRGAI
jgi:hypothetical protein